MLSKSDSEVARLKKLLNEVSSIARSIEEKDINERENVLSFDDENHKAFPTKKRVLARPNKLAILTNFEDESKRLFCFSWCLLRYNKHGTERDRINKEMGAQKDRYVNAEKLKLMSALEAMRFITSPDAYNDSHTHKKLLKSAVKIQSFEKN